MFPNQSTSAYRRLDLMRDAERQRLADFVTCCTQNVWIASIVRVASAVRTRLSGDKSAPASACCAA